jgi:phosphatidylserine/phosphatidylglycerophosphate/cardiolipin synthase-like enzyme
VSRPVPDERRRDGSRPEDWLLTSTERGNPATQLDRRHGGDRTWSTGNDVEPLIHGRTYFAELLKGVRELRAGDLLLFTDWRGDPDERLDGPHTQVSREFMQAAARGVVVKGLIWRSHLDRFRFSETENRHLGEEIEAAGGECLLDMRVRPGGSHHQKFVVLRYLGRPELDVAYVGGIDLCHSRNDDASHSGDPQPQAIAPEYGRRPPWHDIQLAIRGPAVGDIEAVFRERWDDPAPLSRNPLHRLGDLLRGDDTRGSPLPAQPPDPPPRGTHAVSALRTYPYRRHGYPFAPMGERSIGRGYRKALARARNLIYIEDQYLWSPHVASAFADALSANPRLRVIAVVPQFPDADGRFSRPPQLFGRAQALATLRQAGGDRVAVYSLFSHAGTPVYVHGKVCVVDDEWAAVGSDNLNLRSWTYDSELSCAVVDTAGAGGHASGYARALRMALCDEHLDRAGRVEDLIEPRSAFDAFARSAAELDHRYDNGCRGSRPAGRLRMHREPVLSRWTARWAGPLYRWIYDRDGRPPALRREPGFCL